MTSLITQYNNRCVYELESVTVKELVDEISSVNANIVEVVHDRLSSDINAGSAGVTLSLETEGKENADELIKHLKKKNIQFKLLT